MPNETNQLICTTFQTPLCPMKAATTERGICLLEMGSPERHEREYSELETAFQCEMTPGQHSYLDQLQAELSAFFTGDLTEFSVPLDTPGTE